MRKPREPDEKTGLKQTGRVGVAELARGGLDLGGAVHAAEVRRRDAEPVQERVGLRLVVRAADRVRRRDEHGHREGVAVLGQALEVERRLRQHGVDALALDDLEHRVGEAGVRAGRDEVERVAEVAADRALGHVRADEPHLALAVLAQPAQQRRRAGGARGGDEDGDRPRVTTPVRRVCRDRRGSRSLAAASVPTRASGRRSTPPNSRSPRPRHGDRWRATRRSQVDPVGSRAARARRSRSASSIARIVSPIVSPGYAQISGCVSSCSHGNSPARELVVRAAVTPVLVRVGAVVSGSNHGACITLTRAVDRRAHVLRVGVVPGDDRVEALVELERGGRRRAGRRDGRARAAARSRARPRSRRGCRRPTRSSGSRSPRAGLGLELRHRAPRRRARGRRRGAGSGRPSRGSPSKSAKR